MLSEITDIERRFGVTAKQPATCEKHGQYTAMLTKHSPEPSGCPVCAAERQAEQDRIDRQAEAARNAAARLERKLGATLIPKRFQARTFDGYKAETPKQIRALTVCREYAEGFQSNYDAGRCLLLLGKPGTGKTHLASAIAAHISRTTSHAAVYRTVSGILQFVKGSYGESDYTEAEAFAGLIEPGLLIIDEIGATKPTEFEQAVLFQVINGRYEEQKPTIVVSNLMPTELPAVIGERCVDRLREGGGIALVFDWPSMRASL